MDFLALQAKVASGDKSVVELVSQFKTIDYKCLKQRIYFLRILYKCIYLSDKNVLLRRGIDVSQNIHY